MQLAAGVLTSAGASGPLSFAPAASSGGFAGAELSASPPAGASNDYDPGGGWPGTASAPVGVLILTDGGTPGAFNLTGLKAGLARQLAILINNRSNDGTLNNQNAGSLAANRFLCGVGDIYFPIGASLNLLYSPTLSQWIVQT